jgi:hypothetical protein
MSMLPIIYEKKEKSVSVSTNMCTYRSCWQPS